MRVIVSFEAGNCERNFQLQMKQLYVCGSTTRNLLQHHTYRRDSIYAMDTMDVEAPPHACQDHNKHSKLNPIEIVYRGIRNQLPVTLSVYNHCKC